MNSSINLGHRSKLGKAAILIALLLSVIASSLCSAEETDPSSRIVYVEDGEFSKKLHLPLSEWYPKGRDPIGIVLAIHGLTLHGKRYDVLCKAFAAEGFYACAPDMRGFGRCYKDTEHKYWLGDESKEKVDYAKSYADIVALLKLVRQKYPDLPLFALGESLGTSVCIKLAADHPELISGLILSGPTVQLHPLMVIHPHNVGAALWAVFLHPRFNMPTKSFVTNLVSNDENIIEEMLNDPLCRKGLTVAELMKTGSFVKGTLSNANKLRPELPILVLQGSEDRCFVPQGVTKLSHSIHSADQTLRWLHAHGHLLLETSYITPATVDALDSWIREHSPEHRVEVTAIKKEILQLGAKQQNN